MQAYSEKDILDQGFRAKVIREIQNSENKRRKNNAFKAYESFKDLTSNYVIQLLLNQFDQATVLEMQYAVTNISVARKIVDKLARVYSNGVRRSLPKKKDTQNLEEISKMLNINQVMKKANKYLKLMKNTEIYVRPVECEGKYSFIADVLPPFLYDVIEDQNDPSKPIVYILSNFRPSWAHQYSLNPSTEGRTSLSSYNLSLLPSRGDNVDQIIADSPTDKPQDEFIWWTKNYHFTTDAKGVIKSQNDGTNPIGMLPFVSLAADQDNSYWALGGSDIVEGGIKINALLTHINHVSITQGYGQLYMTGKNLPKGVKVGPNHCIQISQEEGEPNPSVGFLSANPPVGDLMKVVEMYVALLLSTNNLSTSNFSSNLQSSKGFASGVALMIDKSESIEDVSDQEQIFLDAEPKMWNIINSWMKVYKQSNLLIDDLQTKPLPDKLDLKVEFMPSQALMTEKEKLEIIKQKDDLGIITQVEKILLDNPTLTEKEALEKLLKIQEEKMSKMLSAMSTVTTGQPQVNVEVEEPEDEKEMDSEEESDSEDMQDNMSEDMNEDD